MDSLWLLDSLHKTQLLPRNNWLSSVVEGSQQADDMNLPSEPRSHFPSRGSYLLVAALALAYNFDVFLRNIQVPGSLCVTHCTPHRRHNGRVREQTVWNAVWPHWGFELSWNLQTPTRDHCGVFFRWAKKRRPRGKPRRVGDLYFGNSPQ